MLTVTNPFLLIKVAGVDFSQLLISTCWSLKVADVAQDVIRRRLVQLFHITNTGRFLQLPLESRKCDISPLPIAPRATPSTLG
jgi:hypothetical protein